MRKNFFIMMLLVVGCLLFVNTVRAQTDYTLLAPIPIPDTSADEGAQTTAEGYITGAFKLLIGIAGALAVVFIIYGGIQYISSDAFGKKSEAKNIIQNALWGFALAMSAWIILSTIDPSLTSLDLSLERQSISGESGGELDLPSFGEEWPDDSTIRNRLEAAGIVITGTQTSEQCRTIGQVGCTSVYDLNPGIVSSLIAIKESCDCEVRITGGTEYWNHSDGTAHRPNGDGGNAVDIATSLQGHLIAEGEDVSGNDLYAERCIPSGAGYTRYVLNGMIFVMEGSRAGAEGYTRVTHLHACYL